MLFPSTINSMYNRRRIVIYSEKVAYFVQTTNPDFGSTRSKDLVVSRKLDSQSNHRWGQSYPHMPSTKIQGHVSSSLDMASGIGNGVVPVKVLVLIVTALAIELMYYPRL